MLARQDSDEYTHKQWLIGFDPDLPPAYLGHKSGEVARTRTIIGQVHTHQFLGTFGGPGNGDYRGELLRAIQVISSYALMPALPPASVLLRLDGLYGDAAPLLDVLAAGLGVIARSRDYTLLDLEIVKPRLLHAPDQVSTHPESAMTRALYDCQSIPLTPAGPEVRLVVATHGATTSSPAVGVERDGTVYELFISTLPSPAFTASDVLDLYLHRGSFETALADEDHEQNSDRWYSHTPGGQEFAQILAQWVWNTRLLLDITGPRETIIKSTVGTQLCSSNCLGGTCYATRHRLSCPLADDGVHAGHPWPLRQGRRALLPYRGETEGHRTDSRRLRGT